jgi:two-component system invasion response regulator UvrY
LLPREVAIAETESRVCSKPKRQRVFVVDDDRSIRETLTILLKDSSELQMIGTAPDCDSAVRETKKLKPDLVLMDLRLPGKSGIEATQEIRCFDTRVKILAYSGYPGGAEEVLSVGANGFITKGRPTKQLLFAIKVVLEGGVYFDEETWSLLKWRLGNEGKKPWAVLSDEERVLAPFLTRGLTSKEMASRLHKKVRRVQKIRANMMRKLGVTNTAGLVFKLAYLMPGIGAF